MNIRNRNVLKQFFASIISERARITEKRDDDDPFGLETGGGDEGGDVDDEPEEKQEKAPPLPTGGNDEDTKDGSNVSIDDVIDKLNSIRSGKSFKDTVVSDRMNKFFEALDPPERRALLQFLNGVAAAVTGIVSQEEIEKIGDPGNPPANVDVKTKLEKQQAKISLKPNVVMNKKKSEPEIGDRDKRQRRQSKEDTTPPIIAKQR